ncbi:pimeloyl-ACP methyl esterase BioG family protein [Paracoccus aminophilus]|uniref:DUF452 family protein n=1 Tax=Paracoccus aminophilus JCM 7686 TaxID=1367847 RepID=S5Y9R2_PARAH|nr:pimeloyl-ACP methyl esterase BioG family protein [Paracoccus aminophilus]AGT08078.1 hypothetical protein JCM7686_0969 [Paracoccus aminophilus JCM 7686]
MRRLWLRQTGAARLIVIFGGWALGPAPFRHLAGAEDVLFLDDWRSPAEPLPELAAYAQADLLAFSFGVAAAGHWLTDHGDPFAHKVAVNGTFFPSDPTRGISPELIRATADELTSESLARFRRRAGFADGKDSPPDLAALRAELLAVAARPPAPACSFDRIWLSERDRIFPPEAMARAWQADAARIRAIAAPHCPFAQWRDWAEVLA